MNDKFKKNLEINTKEDMYENDTERQRTLDFYLVEAGFTRRVFESGRSDEIYSASLVINFI